MEVYAMNMSNVKNMIVLKNLPSNLIEEAIVIVKDTKRIQKYQCIETKNKEDEKSGKLAKRQTEKGYNGSQAIEQNNYIIKEAEMVISHYIKNLETKTPKWNSNMKKLEKRYKKSLYINVILCLATVLSLVLSLI